MVKPKLEYGVFVVVSARPGIIKPFHSQGEEASSESVGQLVNRVFPQFFHVSFLEEKGRARHGQLS